MTRDLARYARSGAWSLIAYAVQIVGAIVVSIVVVRALDPTEIGVLGLARQFTAGVVAISGLALERTYLRFGPELVQRAGGGAAVSLLGRTLVLRVLAWAPFPFFAWFARDLLATHFGPAVGTATFVGVATGLAYSLHAQLRAAATARFATDAVARSSILSAIVTLGATVTVISRGLGVDAVLLAAAGGLLAGCIPLVRPAFDRTRRGELEAGPATDPEAHLSLREARFLAYAWPFAGIAVLNHAIHSQTEVFFLGYWHGAEIAGFFHHGFTFAQRLVDFVPLALWEVSMAGFSRLVTRAPDDLGRAVGSYLVLLYLVMLPLAAFGVAFSPIATILLYGEKMAPAIPVAQAYFAVAAVAALGAPLGMVLYARERTRAVLGAYVVIAAVNLGLDLALIPAMGIPGAILGLAAAKLVAVGLMMVLVRREIGRIEVAGGFFARATAASTVVLLAWPLTLRFPTWAGAVICLGLALGALWIAVRALRVVGEDEADLVRRTGLPATGFVLRCLGHPAEAVR